MGSPTRIGVTFGVFALFTGACVLSSGLDGLSGGTAGAPADGGSADGRSGPLETIAGNEGGAGTCGADVSSDAKNCGRCGHDCLGTGCVAGLCQPALLATASSAVHSLRVQGTSLYWVAADSSVFVHSTSSDGSNGTPVVTANTAIRRSITTDAQSLYLSEGANSSQSYVVRRCLIPGWISPSSLATSSTTNFAEFLTVDGQAGYWIEGLDRVVRCPLTGCPSGPELLCTLPDAATGMTLSKDRVFAGAAGSFGSNAALYSCALSPGSPPREVDPGSASGIVAVDTTLYWSGLEAIRTCALPDCASPSTFFATGSTLLMVDSTDVTWIEQRSDQSILRCPRAGCVTPTVIYTLPGGTISDAVDDAKQIYFASGVSIFRLPK